MAINLRRYLIFISFCYIGCYQILYADDPFTGKFPLINTGNRNYISNPESLSRFNTTDSIFSLRSSNGYVPSLIHNLGEQASAPFRFKTKQWVIAGAAVGITTALMYLDNDIDSWACTQKRDHRWINTCSPVITELGGNFGILSVAATGILSSVCKDQKAVETTLLSSQALITSGIWVYLIKNITGRERPKAAYIYSQTEGGRWYGPIAKFDQDPDFVKAGSAFDAFPSGHTATVFAIATVIASEYKDTKAIPIISYSMATLVGISRLTEHQHWSSDVFVGALIGYLCGKQVVAHYNDLNRNSERSFATKSKNRAEFSLVQNGREIGISVRF